MSPCISYHHSYPCFVAFYDCHSYYFDCFCYKLRCTKTKLQNGSGTIPWPFIFHTPMAMKSTPFCITGVVADNVLECFANLKAEIAMIRWIGGCPLSRRSSVVKKMMNILLLLNCIPRSCDIALVLRHVQPSLTTMNRTYSVNCFHVTVYPI